jgi:hypothetical protein
MRLEAVPWQRRGKAPWGQSAARSPHGAQQDLMVIVARRGLLLVVPASLAVNGHVSGLPAQAWLGTMGLPPVAWALQP